MKGKVSVALFLIVGVVILGYYLLSHKQQEKYARAAAKISIGSPRQESSALLYLAKEKGYFSKNGLDVEIKNYDFGLLAIRSLLAKEIDIAIATDFAFVKNSFENNGLRILCAIAKADVEQIIARKDSGISQTADLKGKKIGLKKGTSAEFHIEGFSLFNGIQMRETDIVDLSPSKSVEAILKKQIDAAVLWPPHTYRLENALGENAISWSAQSGEAFFWLALTTKTIANKNQSAFERFLKSLEEASNFLRNNKTDAKKIVIDYLQPDIAHIDANWPKNIFMVELPQSLLLRMEDEARWEIGKGLRKVKAFPNYLDFMLIDLFKKSLPNSTNIPY